MADGGFMGKPDRLESMLTHSLVFDVPNNWGPTANDYLIETGANEGYICQIGEQPRGVPVCLLPNSGGNCLYVATSGVKIPESHEVYRIQ